MGTDGTGWAEGPGPDGNARVLAGRYRLEGRLGRGGMGVVWRATDRLLGRQVAVKELALGEGDALSADEAGQQRERTLREARALAQLGHPHIIGVHDVIEADGRPYIVMELVDGPSLAELISRSGPVDAREAARIGIALLGALRKAHASGVLHRDLKPANVLLEADTGRVVLTDFGIAQVTGATTLTESGSFLGSPEYTSPERMSGARTGPESDLWSLGALLCAAVSGTSPFRRDSLSAVLLAVVSDEIRVPAQARELLPVISGLLERDPDRRLDAAEAERMLRAYAETGRVPPLPPGAGPLAERGAARVRRAPLGARLSHLPLPHRRKGPGGGTAGPPAEPSPAPRMLRRSHRPSWRGTPRTRPADRPRGADGADGTDEFPQPPVVRESPRVWESPEDRPPRDAQRTPGVPEPREPADHTFADQERPTAVAHPAAPEAHGRPPATGGSQLPPAAGGAPRPAATPWPPDATGPWPPADAEPWSTGSAVPEAGSTVAEVGSSGPESGSAAPEAGSSGPDGGNAGPDGGDPGAERMVPEGTAPQAGAAAGSPGRSRSRDSADRPGPQASDDGPESRGSSDGSGPHTSAADPAPRDSAPPPYADDPPPTPARTARTMLVTAVLVAVVAGTGVSALALLADGDGNGRPAPRSSAPASSAGRPPTSSASASRPASGATHAPATAPPGGSSAHPSPSASPPTSPSPSPSVSEPVSSSPSARLSGGSS